MEGRGKIVISKGKGLGQVRPAFWPGVGGGVVRGLSMQVTSSSFRGWRGPRWWAITGMD